MWPYDLIYPAVKDFLDRFTDFFDAIGENEIIQNFAADANAFATIESIHVLAVVMVVGTILFVDLRLLGFIGRGNSVRRASSVLPYTWWAFLVAVVSGTLLFAVKATRYADAEPFQIKMLLLLAAGINMAIFHYGIWRSVDVWDEGRDTPLAAKISGLLSLLLWTGVVFYGRFTAWAV